MDAASEMPDAKRSRESLDGGRVEDAAKERSDLRDKKKKRKKKKRKQPVVQQGHEGEANGPSDRRSRSMSANSRPTVAPANKPKSPAITKQSTPGPSNIAPQDVKESSPDKETHASGRRSHTPVSDDHPNGTPGLSSPIQTSLPSSKGKERARSAEQIPSSASEDPALAAHRSLLDTMLPSITCQICLLLMHRPFSLAPCGHTSCHACLINWFSSPASNQNQAPALVDPPPPQAPGPADPAPPDGGPPPPPANLPPILVPAPLVARRKKTCPHCRAAIRERPIELWAIKDMVNAVIQSGLADPESIPLELREGAPPAEPSSTDLWKDIFPPVVKRARPAWRDLLSRETMGIQDEEDGGIYRCIDCTHEIADGVCTHCGRVYMGHRADIADLNHMLDEADSDFLGGMYSDDETDDADFAPLGWLAAHFDGHDGSDHDSGSEDFDARHRFRTLSDGEIEIFSISGSDSEGESYEGSFIDDEDANGGGSGDDDDDDDDDNGGDAPRGARPRSRQPLIYISSSSEDSIDEVMSEPEMTGRRLQSRGRRRRRTHFVLSDDEDEGGGENDEAV